MTDAALEYPELDERLERARRPENASQRSIALHWEAGTGRHLRHFGEFTFEYSGISDEQGPEEEALQKKKTVKWYKLSEFVLPASFSVTVLFVLSYTIYSGQFEYAVAETVVLIMSILHLFGKYLEIFGRK